MKNLLIFSLFIIAPLLANTKTPQDKDQVLSLFKTTALSQKDNSLTAIDLKELVIRDQHISALSNVQHSYVHQYHKGIQIHMAISSIHLLPDGSILKFNNQLVNQVASKVNTSTPAINALQATQAAATALSITPGTLNTLQLSKQPNQQQTISKGSLSKENIPAKLIYVQTENGYLLLAWELFIKPVNSADWWSMRIDATTGKLLDQENHVLFCNHDSSKHKCSGKHSKQQVTYEICEDNSLNMAGSYRVYALPISDPTDGSRTLVNDPDDALASPYGWHDTNGSNGAEHNITRGNNVNAYDNGNNSGYSPNGGSTLSFDFPLDLSQDPNNYEDAGITNAFYWGNLTHDILYHYGFDEASGNFQVNNYGKGGIGTDHVNIRVQSSNNCNGSFGSSPDGNTGSMTLYVCSGVRDGAYNNTTIMHEYGHGWSRRLAGGPSTTSCISNQEQMGEGWCDYLAITLTIESTDTRSDSRPYGSWFYNNPNGIRPFTYNTDLSVNDATYNDIKTVSVPHGVGNVWATMLWDMTWDLIDIYGFDPDVYSGTGGNNISIALVSEGLKLQQCNPGFVSGRDAILLADQALYNSANQCLIWNAFAKRGLGYSADEGSTSSRSDGTEAYDLPPGSGTGLGINKTADKSQALPNETITYTLNLTNNCNSSSSVNIDDVLPQGLTYVPGSASNGGTHNNGTITWNVPVNQGVPTVLTYQAKVGIGAGSPPNPSISDDMESGASNWTTSSRPTNSPSQWQLQPGNPCGSTGWYAEELEGGSGVTRNQYLVLKPIIINGPNTTLTFDHFYDTEINWDGGTVELSTNSGTSWIDLGDYMTSGGYNNYIKNTPSIQAFAGLASSCVTTTVDLSSFSCVEAIIRFNFYYDGFAVGTPNNVPDGWYIDAIDLTTDPAVVNSATATVGNISVTSNHCIELLGCPDLSPVLTLIPSNITGISSIAAAIEISEVQGTPTDNVTPIKVRMPTDPRISFIWEPGLTSVAFRPVQNSDWTYLGNNGVFHEFQCNEPIAAYSTRAFGFNAMYDPQSTQGETTLSVTVFPFAGGECSPSNNVDAEKLVYFE